MTYIVDTSIQRYMRMLHTNYFINHNLIWNFPCEQSTSQIFLNTGFPLCEWSMMWVFFFSRISYHDNTMTTLLIIHPEKRPPSTLTPESSHSTQRCFRHQIRMSGAKNCCIKMNISKDFFSAPFDFVDGLPATYCLFPKMSKFHESSAKFKLQ